MRKLHFILIIFIILAGCSQISKFPGAETETNDDFSKTVMEDKLEDRDIKLPDGSTLVENKSNFQISEIFGGPSTDFSFNVLAFNVALDKLNFMPLASVDVSAGVIVTDWYSLDGGDQRIKINVRIMDKELQDTSIDVKLFKQTYDGNRWVDNGQDQPQAIKVKESILKEARALQIASEM